MQVEVATSPVERIRAVVDPMFAARGVQPPREPRADLRAAGLTSLDMVNLMLGIEAEFDVFIPQERITTANFATVAAIESAWCRRWRRSDCKRRV